MRFRVLVPLLVASLTLFAGCASTPQDRISQNRRLYESFPAEVQRKVSAGIVDVGFTPEMVQLALGEPGRRLTRVEAEGSSEVWVYFRAEPRISFGIGIGSGSYHRHSGTSTAVGVSTETGGAEETQRIVFRDGRVTAIERSGR